VGTPPIPLPGSLYCERINAQELDRARRLLVSVSWRLDRIATEEGWPTPFAPVRYLILTLLERASAYGLPARRLAGLLDLSPSTVAHHLDVLEQAGFVHREPWTPYDRRRVAVRLTETGRYAVRRFTGAPAEERGAGSSA
jgi:DNA-binding MarR family transcriptional regulator